LLLPDETQGLLLIELGAEVPAWLDTPCFAPLPQQHRESLAECCTRACDWLDRCPQIAYVILALAESSHPRIDKELSAVGRRLVECLSRRTKARLLLCVPAETSERERKGLLALAADLVKDGDSRYSVVVGAHFSARPPPSGTLPVFRATPKKELTKV
jgi:hypothetical protein